MKRKRLSAGCVMATLVATGALLIPTFVQAGTVIPGSDNTVTAGGNRAFAMGNFGTAASGYQAIAMGEKVTASGTNSIAMGTQTEASAYYATAMGKLTQASATGATAMGGDSIASGSYSTAMGNYTNAKGYVSTAMGSYTKATGSYSTAMGEATTAEGYASTAMGELTKATGNYSTASGYDSTASGDVSTAMGAYSYAEGENSVAMSGANTTVDASNSIAMGSGASATVSDAVALGSGSVANVTAGKIGYLANGNTSSTWVSTANAIAVGDPANGITRQITGVAAGTADTDAVNVAQLRAVNSHVDNRINRVGAGAAALAGLHPLDFNPDDKWDFAFGYGNYQGANALAIGAYYRPNEDTMFSFGGSFSSGENMINAGISFKLGQQNGVTTSRIALAKEVKDLKVTVDKLTELVLRQDAMINKLVGGNGTSSLDSASGEAIAFPDIPQNHWAYDYVESLVKKGIIEGYPDGTFKGDRSMSRYEFAAMLARALLNGHNIQADPNGNRLLEEFKADIARLNNEYYRIDRISGKDSDRHKIDRIRVNNREENRDVYGGIIANR